MKQDQELTQESILYGGRYVNEKFKSKDLVEAHLAANGAAHGYYMGAKHSEKEELGLSNWAKIKKLFTKEDTFDVAQQAVKYYLKQKKLHGIPRDHRAILSSALVEGFQEGMKK